jgi:nucleotide-binding universal stress UspA family protein
MKIGKILIAYDGSEESEKAFDLGLDLCLKYSARMLVLSVARPPEPPIVVETQAVIDAASEYFEERHGGLKFKGQSAGIDPKCEIRVGHPAQQILQMANDEPVQMIVMGHRGGGSFLQRWRLGSVARRVIDYAQCSVVVVR